MNKKVLFSATVDSHIMQFHLPYLKWFKEQGYEVHVATNGTQNIPYCDVKHVVPFERKPIKINNLKAIRILKKIIQKENFDIIHCHTPMGGVVTRLAAKKSRRNGTRVIYTAHGFHFYKGAPILNWLVYYPVEKYLAKYTDTIITINKEDYELANKKFSKRCHDIQYVPGVGIDENKFNFEMSNEEKIDLRNSLGLKEEDFVMIYPAELSNGKRQIWLINTLSELIKKHKDIHLLLPGEDSLNGKCQEVINKLNLINQVHCLGYRKDIPILLKASDLALSSSNREGLPVNIMEAMYVGLPIVASNCRGNRDLVVDKVNGYLVDLKDSTKFAKCVEELYLKKNNEYTKNNINDAQKFLLNKTMPSVINIYLRKKIILHLLASNTLSGAENVACTIIKNLSNNFDMFYCSPDGKIRETLQERGIKFIPLERLSYLQVRRIVKSLKPDIIHAHDNKATVFASFFYKRCKIISHIHSNNTIMNSKNLKTMLFNYSSKRIKRFICVSDSTFDNYYYKNNIKDKSVVLYNTIDSEEIINKANKYQIDEEYDLIFLGRLEHQKNPERLIEVLRLLKKEKDDICMAIVGDGSYRQKIEKQIVDFNLKSNVTMYGFQKNPYPILKNSKILIMTSLYEGTPMVALEAQALGVPIIATPVDGLLKVIKNDYNGFLSNDNILLVKKVIDLLNDENKYLEFIKHSKEIFDTYNNINKYLKQISFLYMD